MTATMIVEVPQAVQNRVDKLARDNFYLWMFIAQQDLWEEAIDFLNNNKEMEAPLDFWHSRETLFMDNDVPF